MAMKKKSLIKSRAATKKALVATSKKGNVKGLQQGKAAAMQGHVGGLQGHAGGFQGHTGGFQGHTGGFQGHTGGFQGVGPGKISD